MTPGNDPSSNNIFGTDVKRVVSNSVPVGKAILGDFSKLRVYVREDAQLAIAQVDHLLARHVQPFRDCPVIERESIPDLGELSDAHLQRTGDLLECGDAEEDEERGCIAPFPLAEIEKHGGAVQRTKPDHLAPERP